MSVKERSCQTWIPLRNYSFVAVAAAVLVVAVAVVVVVDVVAVVVVAAVAAIVVAADAVAALRTYRKKWEAMIENSRKWDNFENRLRNSARSW